MKFDDDLKNRSVLNPSQLRKINQSSELSHIQGGMTVLEQADDLLSCSKLDHIAKEDDPEGRFNKSYMKHLVFNN